MATVFEILGVLTFFALIAGGLYYAHKRGWV